MDAGRELVTGQSSRFLSVVVGVIRGEGVRAFLERRWRVYA